MVKRGRQIIERRQSHAKTPGRAGRSRDAAAAT
jgi:hypothetical protein